jgi:4,5-dihydroxyphthalate decarboxylase
MLPLLHAEVEETFDLFGNDPWPDGVAANRLTLEKAISYMAEDGLIERQPALDELFPDCA